MQTRGKFEFGTKSKQKYFLLLSRMFCAVRRTSTKLLMASMEEGFLLHSQWMVYQNVLLNSLKSEYSLVLKSSHDLILDFFTVSAAVFCASVCTKGVTGFQSKLYKILCLNDTFLTFWLNQFFYFLEPHQTTSFYNIVQMKEKLLTKTIFTPFQYLQHL